MKHWINLKKMKSMNIKEYISMYKSLGNEKLRDLYTWIEEVGKTYEYDKDLTSKLLKGNEPRIKLNGCYENAFRMVHYTSGYIMGFYITEIGLPLEHAFNHVDGKGVDFTSCKYGFEVKDLFGIEVPLDVVIDWYEQSSQMPLLGFYYFHYVQKEGVRGPFSMSKDLKG